MNRMMKHQAENPVTQDDLEDFNPASGPCCNVANFRLHLAGTPCNPWNKSAAGVFVESFLGKYTTDYPSNDEAVVDMVRFKTQSTIAAKIKRYRMTGPDGNMEPATKKRLNRQERKRKVSSSSPIHCGDGFIWVYLFSSFSNAVTT